jgi:MFS family permease
MVVLGVIIFACASALCGLTPSGGGAETWLITFRAVQGAGGAIMFPAAIAIVVATFDLRSRGRALALFFGIAGALTAIGPITGGYLIQWTWRAIFWINIPVAIIALILITISKPVTEHRPAPMDYRGLALIIAGVGLSVFGFQQSAIWGWGNPATGGCIAAGVLLLIAFVAVEQRTESPLINVRIFRTRPFLVENIRSPWRRRPRRPACCCSTSSSASWSSRRSAAGCWTGSAPSGRWCSAASWPRSASPSGRGR